MTNAAFEAAQNAAYEGTPKPDFMTDDVKQGLQALIRMICPYKALEKQKRFMCRKMRKPVDMKVHNYVNNIHRINYDELP